MIQTIGKVAWNRKADLICCAEDILLTREHYFPATIRANTQANANAEMYDPVRGALPSEYVSASTISGEFVLSGLMKTTPLKLKL